MTGDELVALAKTQIGKPYVLGANVDLTSADPPIFDCAEFLSWLTYQATKQLRGCLDNHVPVARAEPYSAAWAQDIRTGVVESISIDEAIRTAGAVLARAPTKGRMGHVALSDGDGGTVEAHSTRRGVIAGQARRRPWTHAGLIPGIEYGEPDALIYGHVEPAVLRIGDRGADVQELQEALVRRYELLSAAGFGAFDGLNPGAPDARFGPRTRAAVYAWQVARGLAQSGEVTVGGETAMSLGLS